MHIETIVNPKYIQRGKNTKYHKLITPSNLSPNSIKKAIDEILTHIKIIIKNSHPKNSSTIIFSSFLKIENEFQNI